MIRRFVRAALGPCLVLTVSVLLLGIAMGFAYAGADPNPVAAAVLSPETSGTAVMITNLLNWMLADPSHIVVVAGVIAALTPTPNPNTTMGKLYKIIDLFALNFLHAKSTGVTPAIISALSTIERTAPGTQLAPLTDAAPGDASKGQAGFARNLALPIFIVLGGLGVAFALGGCDTIIKSLVPGADTWSNGGIALFEEYLGAGIQKEACAAKTVAGLPPKNVAQIQTGMDTLESWVTSNEKVLRNGGSALDQIEAAGLDALVPVVSDVLAIITASGSGTTQLATLSTLLKVGANPDGIGGWAPVAAIYKQLNANPGWVPGDDDFTTAEQALTAAYSCAGS